MISVSLTLSKTHEAMDMPAATPVSTSCLLVDFHYTHCAYPLKNGQTELTWVAGWLRFICPQAVTHGSNNWAGHIATVFNCLDGG